MNKNELKDARLKWLWQKNNAKRRGIEFDFPFEQWLQFWLDSGHWNQRGIGNNGYVMSRIGDTGPYRIDNVEIKSNLANLSEGNKGKFVSAETRQRMSKGQQGRKMTEKARLKMIQELTGKQHPRLTCLHCRAVIANNNMDRHFNSEACAIKKAPWRRVLSLNYLTT